MYSQAHGGKQVFQNLSFYLDFRLNTEILSGAQILSIIFLDKLTSLFSRKCPPNIQV